MLDILIGIGVSMVASKGVSSVLQACGVSETTANLIGRGVSTLVGAEMNAHHDVPMHHGHPSPSLLHDTGAFAEFRRSQVG